MNGATQTKPRRSGVQRCPRCSLINPGTAIFCDCGFDLRAAPSEIEHEIEGRTRGAAGRIGTGVALMVLGMAAMVVSYLVLGRSYPAFLGSVVVGFGFLVSGMRRRAALRRDMSERG